jgi:hypothetical protein
MKLKARIRDLVDRLKEWRRRIKAAERNDRAVRRAQFERRAPDREENPYLRRKNRPGSNPYLNRGDPRHD